VLPMRTAPAHARCLLAIAFALLLALRLLSPAGFMPAFDRGGVTIVACPDAGLAGSIDAHHAEHSKKLHATCPYAAASGLGSIASDVAPLLALLILSVPLLLGRTFQFLERSRAHERPPLRGPPLPA
jgi:hypothetical protein